MVTSGPEAGWYRDPSGRHDHRWWDGTTWTPYVLTLGLRSVDYGDPDDSGAADTEEADLPDAGAPDAETPDPEVPEPEVPVATATSRPLAAWVVVFVGAALLVVGALLPWGEATSKTASFSSDGIDGNGAITLVAAVVLVLLFVVVQRTTTAAWLVIATAVVAGAIGVRDAVDLSDKAARLVDQGPPGVSANVGIGVWVTIAGAVIALVGGIMALAMSSRGIGSRTALTSERRTQVDGATSSSPYFDQSSGFGSVYSPITVPSTASTCTRPRMVGGASALYSRMRHTGRERRPCHASCALGVPDREADRARRDRAALRSGRSRAATRTRSGTRRRARARSPQPADRRSTTVRSRPGTGARGRGTSWPGCAAGSSAGRDTGRRSR